MLVANAFCLFALFFKSLISLSPDQRKSIIDNTVKGTMTERVAPSTLKDFSVEYFRYLQQMFD